MGLYYIYDDSVKEKLNSEGKDYTSAYIPALLRYMGATAKRITPGEGSSLRDDDILIVGASDMTPLTFARVIRLGPSPDEADPVTKTQRIFADGIGEGGTLLPIFVPVCPSDGSQKTVRFAVQDGDMTPAVTGDESGVCFRFDLCATVWYSGDGFVQDGPKNGCDLKRVPDESPIPRERSGGEFNTAYNDELTGWLEEILHSYGVPMLYRLPPDRGEIPDFALTISGDDDYTSCDFDMNGYKVIHDLGLRYHINMMPSQGKFMFYGDRLDEVREMGGEIGLHTNFYEVPYTDEGQSAACRLYREAYGDGFGIFTNNNHCLFEDGPCAERLRRLEMNGVVSDNSKLGETDPSDINAYNLRGFSFGSSFPRYTCDDAGHGNRLIECFEIPINYYEPRIGGTPKYSKPEKITGYVDDAAKYGRIMQLFIHPHYLWPENPNAPMAVKALETARSYWKSRNYDTLITTVNDISEFWKGRSGSAAERKGDEISLSLDVDAAVILPDEVSGIYVDGKAAEIKVKTVNNRILKMAVCEKGKHIITLNK